MRRVPFDRLHTVCLTYESRAGHTEICREPDGTRWIRLCIRSDACQRELLSGLDESVPVRLESGVLEVLLPCHEGISLRQWLYEQKPDLSRRRDACLSLLEQLVEGNVPPCLIALSANTENLTLTGRSMFLQYLPELRQWEPGIDEAQAVRAVAAVICEVLSEKAAPWQSKRIPEELSLLNLRRQEQDYTSWSQLQRDVAAVPDTLPGRSSVLRPYIRRVRGWLCRYGKYLLRVLAALLLTAALLSLISAYRRYAREKNEIVWQGMPQVGDQDLRNGEDGE